ncbi:MAG: hypothetical protein A2Y38_15525 [Spirochaetes bacterium GWB1_59_5]|nr:MAG: hypothetical protein A2Y38_15525 [Spirochaetes bacterium GWB1_59_5]
MSIHCPKCGAGTGSLETRTEHLVSGTVLQVVTCLICRFRAAREVFPPPIQSARPVVRRKYHPPRDVVQTLAARAANIAANTHECAIPGCTGTYYAPTSKNPLCKVHRTQLSRWESRLRPGIRGASPGVICVNGHWIERGQPLPGIPGERPVYAEAVIHPNPYRPQVRTPEERQLRKRARGQGGGKNRAGCSLLPGLRLNCSSLPVAAMPPAGRCW